MKWVSDMLQLLANLAVVLALPAAIYQLIRQRVEGRTERYLALLEYLQRERATKARRTVLQAFKSRQSPLDPGDASFDQDAAHEVCRTYETVGILVSQDDSLQEIIVDNWADSIVKSWVALSVHVAARRKDEVAYYGKNFGHLVMTCVAAQPYLKEIADSALVQ
jgi:hypothetical protein